MAFPINPTNGQQTTQNGIVYIYNAALGVWSVVGQTPGDIGANSITTNSVAADTVTVTGTVSAGNVSTSGAIAADTVSATGNISGSYFVGNGSQLTGVNGGTAATGILQNAQNITANVDIPTDFNGISVGPITQSPGTVITQAAGSRWVIL